MSRPAAAENDLAARYDVVVVVATQPQTQLRRLVEQRGMTEQDARSRIDAQAPLEAKLAVADLVVSNDGTLEDLDRLVKQVWADLRARAERTTGS